MVQSAGGCGRRNKRWRAAPPYGGVAGVRRNGPPGPYSSLFLSQGDARYVVNPTPCSVRGCSTAARRNGIGADRPTPVSNPRKRGGTEKGEKGRISCLPPHEAPRHAVVEEDVAVQRVNAQHDELELGNGGAEQRSGNGGAEQLGNGGAERQRQRRAGAARQRRAR